MGKAVYFFLGANSRSGFYSLYEDFAETKKDDFLWLIKGGPGCGKSSFMRRIGKAAEKAGLDVEYICCSGDPDSLDGIYIPEKHIGYVDATAPHKMDAVLPAAGDAYLDLGAFYRIDKLRSEQSRLAEMNIRYKHMYSRIYSLLSAAGQLGSDTVPGLVADADEYCAIKRAKSTAEREFGNGSGQKGAQKHRFISAISCKGLIRTDISINSLCSRIYAIDDGFSLANTYLSVLAQEAAKRGLDSIVCHDPLDPRKIEALLIPELSLGFIADRPLFGELKPTRNVRLDSVIARERVQLCRRKIRFASKIKSALLNETVLSLKEAKALHDEIEQIYNPHVDFDGLYELCDKHIEMMLSK